MWDGIIWMGVEAGLVQVSALLPDLISFYLWLGVGIVAIGAYLALDQEDPDAPSC